MFSFLLGPQTPYLKISALKTACCFKTRSGFLRSSATGSASSPVALKYCIGNDEVRSREAPSNSQIFNHFNRVTFGLYKFCAIEDFLVGAKLPLALDNKP